MNKRIEEENFELYQLIKELGIKYENRCENYIQLPDFNG